MALFDGASSFQGLTFNDREALLSLLDKRAEYFAHQANLSRLRVQAIQNPSAETVDAVTDYSRTWLKPLRDSMSSEIRQLLKAAVDVEGLKEMLPAALSALSHSINIELVLAIFGADPDIANEAIVGIGEYFNQGI